MDHLLTTAHVLQEFSREISGHGGRVTDTFDDGERLFVRGVLPDIEEAKSNDRLQGGVALKASDGDVWIHPYLYRLVCKNGAIMAQSFGSRRLEGLFDLDPEIATITLRGAVAACCATEVFTHSMEQVRSSTDIRADLSLNLLSVIGRWRSRLDARTFQEILKRFFGDEDRTRFGLMNAITATARDTKDPQLKWNLEELGGGVPASANDPAPRTPGRAAARRERAVLVS